MKAKRIILYNSGRELSMEAYNYLVKNGIVFENVDITKNGGQSLMQKYTRWGVAPVLEVKWSHGIGTVVGFSSFLYDRELRLNEFSQKKKSQQTLFKNLK